MNKIKPFKITNIRRGLKMKVGQLSTIWCWSAVEHKISSQYKQYNTYGQY